MSRTFLLPLIAAASLAASAGFAAPAVTRGNLVFDGIPEPSGDSLGALEAYLSGRDAAPLGFTPKGQLLIATRFGEVNQLHLVDRAGAARRQLTFLREPIVDGAFSPDPNRNAFFYLKDSSGDGNAQLYYQHVGDIAAKRLTDGKSLNGSPVWSNAGREIAFFSTARDGASYDIDIVDPEGGALPRLAVTGDGAAWIPLDWSPDDRKLLVKKHAAAGEDYLYVIDIGTGQKREVDPAASKVSIGKAKFSRDSTGVYYISDRDGEFAKLRYLNLFTSEKIELSGRSPWDVDDFALSKDGRCLAYAINEGGAGKLALLDLRSHQDLIPPRLPAAGVVDSLSFDAESKRLVFAFSAPNEPRDAYVLEVEGNRLEAWTASEPGPMDKTKFVMPRLSQFPTFDRSDGKSRQIPMYIYEPASAGPHPVLIVLRGGPGPEFRPSFDPFIAYVVNELGYAVLAPNVRGSSGYGKSYASLDKGLLREDAVKDVGALLVWLALDNRFDAKRVVVSGEGYGGYLALAAVVNYGERLKGGVDFAGITDFIDYLGAAAANRQSQERLEFGDEKDPDTRAFLRRISPLTGADRIVRPLLVVHGKNDAVVPIGQSEQLVNRLRSRGRTVWYLKATDEGGRFLRRQSSEAYYRAFAQFLLSPP